MRDNPLITLLRMQLIAGLAVRGCAHIAVQQPYQPDQQATSSDTTLYIHKVADTRIGSPRRHEFYNGDNGKMIRRVSQQMFTRFQFSSSMIPDRTNPLALTAADISKLCAEIVQSPDYQAAILKKGVNILRVADIPSTDVESDTVGFEQRPLFEMQVSHVDEYDTEINALSRIEPDVHGI